MASDCIHIANIVKKTLGWAVQSISKCTFIEIWLPLHTPSKMKPWEFQTNGDATTVPDIQGSQWQLANFNRFHSTLGGLRYGGLSKMSQKQWVGALLSGHTTLPKTNSLPLKIGRAPKGNSYSNHPFSGATLVSGRVANMMLCSQILENLLTNCAKRSTEMFKVQLLDVSFVGQTKYLDIGPV